MFTDLDDLACVSHFVVHGLYAQMPAEILWVTHCHSFRALIAST